MIVIEYILGLMEDAGASPVLAFLSLSEDDFLHEIDMEIFYHRSGCKLTYECLSFSLPGQIKDEIEKYVSSLVDKEERIERFSLYKEHYKFVYEFKIWLFDKIIEEVGILNLTYPDKVLEIYRSKRREYINGWEQGKQWSVHDLTNDPTRIPAQLRKEAIKAWEYVINYRDLFFRGNNL